MDGDSELQAKFQVGGALARDDKSGYVTIQEVPINNNQATEPPRLDTEFIRRAIVSGISLQLRSLTSSTTPQSSDAQKPPVQVKLVLFTKTPGNDSFLPFMDDTNVQQRVMIHTFTLFTHYHKVNFQY